MRLNFRNVLILSALLAAVPAATQAAEFRTPAGTRPAARRPGAESVLPGGRMIEPLGRAFQTGPGAFGLVLSPDGRFAVTANGGPDRFSLTVLDMNSEPWQVAQIRAPKKEEREEAAKDDDDDWHSVFMGLAFADNKRLFASEGNSGRVREIALPAGKLLNMYKLDQGEWKDSFSGDLAFDATRHLLYVVDQANFRVAIFNTKTQKLVASVKTGRLPFRMALSPDRKRLYVTNIGMFEYQGLAGADRKRARETGLPFPAFGFPSPESRDGARRETARGPVDVPGLGDPNVRESNSVCVVNV